jgi:hypothetical protein
MIYLYSIDYWSNIFTRYYKKFKEKIKRDWIGYLISEKNPLTRSNLISYMLSVNEVYESIWLVGEHKKIYPIHCIFAADIIVLLQKLFKGWWDNWVLGLIDFEV